MTILIMMMMALMIIMTIMMMIMMMIFTMMMRALIMAGINGAGVRGCDKHRGVHHCLCRRPQRICDKSVVSATGQHPAHSFVQFKVAASAADPARARRLPDA